MAMEVMEDMEVTEDMVTTAVTMGAMAINIGYNRL